MNNLGKMLSTYWNKIKGYLFPLSTYEFNLFLELKIFSFCNFSF